MQRYLFMLRKFSNFIFYLLFAIPIHATTVLPVQIDELARNSELIFEGSVRSKEVRVSLIDGRPCTYFLFAIEEVIKGTYQQPTIELCFTGGTLAGKTMQVSGMTMPGVGETGIYFVDALGNEPIHPLLGWHQGHYLVKKDSSQVKRVIPAHPEYISPPDVLNNFTRELGTAPEVEAFKRMIRDRL